MGVTCFRADTVLLLKLASMTAKGATMADQGIEESGPWVGRSVAPGAGKGNPTSQGWPMTRRPRQRGPDSIISDEIGGRRMEIKMTEIANNGIDRKSTRLNSSHSQISYAVFCLKKKKK